MQDSPGAAVAMRAPRDIALREWDDRFARLVKRTVLKPKNREATNVELALFAEQVQRTGLNPFLGQIYAIYRYDGRAKDEVMSVQVGIDGFRLVAERSGRYDGQTPPEWSDADGNWTSVWLSSLHPSAARVGVFKTGRSEPTYAVAHWSEYVQTNAQGNPTGMWPTMPANQLLKCAEALALRKAFPAELSGIYTPEEMAQADNPRAEVEQEVVGAGVGNGNGDDAPLPAAVEAVLARASELGHAGLANRAAAAVAVTGQPEEFVAEWCARRVRELVAFEEAQPPDAEVVDEFVAEMAPPGEATMPTPEMRAAMHRRANDLLDRALDLESRGEVEEAGDARAEAEALHEAAGPEPEDPEQLRL